jgi:hypothetical protein
VLSPFNAQRGWACLFLCLLPCKICVPGSVRNLLHNPSLRVTIHPIRDEKTLPVRGAATGCRPRAGSVFDHIDYHRQARNTRKQCFKEGQRVSKTQQERRNIAINKQKKVWGRVWDHQAAGSSPVTRTYVKSPDCVCSQSSFFLLVTVCFIDYCGAGFAPACALRHFVANV